jgi:hypothetical protein
MRAYHGASHGWHWRQHLVSALLKYQTRLPVDPRAALARSVNGLVADLRCTAAEATAILRTAAWDVDYCSKHYRRPSRSMDAATMARLRGPQRAGQAERC